MFLILRLHQFIQKCKKIKRYFPLLLIKVRKMNKKVTKKFINVFLLQPSAFPTRTAAKNFTHPEFDKAYTERSFVA
ncbi:hypothetical protein C6496_11895 [Candidatus Poribacteria bacterium]|nr:MAG: hypothetical protein C6496_11895 [Candidatus Poribacteria bacterium]